MSKVLTKTAWLKIGARAKYGRWEITTVACFVKSKPACKANEIAIKLQLEVPDSIFEEPTYEMKVALPSITRKAIEPAELSKEMSKALSERMGLKVKVSMEGPAEKPFSESLKSL